MTRAYIKREETSDRRVYLNDERAVDDGVLLDPALQLNSSKINPQSPAFWPSRKSQSL
jgi:hypothetical protein